VVHAHGDAELQGEQHFGEDGFNAAAEGKGLGGVGLRKKQSEFIATNAKSGIGSTQRFAQSGGRSAQDVITAGMTVLVVHFLEAMKVQDYETERTAIAMRAIEFLLEGFAEEATIVEACEGISNSVEL